MNKFRCIILVSKYVPKTGTFKFFYRETKEWVKSWQGLRYNSKMDLVINWVSYKWLLKIYFLYFWNVWIFKIKSGYKRWYCIKGISLFGRSFKEKVILETMYQVNKRHKIRLLLFIVKLNPSRTPRNSSNVLRNTLNLTHRLVIYGHKEVLI